MTRINGSRAPGAFLRAGLVALLVALPQLLLRPAGAQAQLVPLFALLAAFFTLAEYSARAPSLVEFRDARPYNRLRVATVFAAILVACACLRTVGGDGPLATAGQIWAELLDRSWSPLQMLRRTLPPEAHEVLREAILAAAAAAYGLSLLMVVLFALLVRLRGWPGRSSFNLWVNLPQFDPTSGGDVVDRLQQNALVNVSLGLLLPFLAPLLVDIWAPAFEAGRLTDPAMLVWVVIAWAFLPASLAMRGLALHRLAVLITAHRRRHGLAQPA